MTGNAQRTEGRERVRTILWARLDEAGIKRCQGQTQEQYQKMRKRLTEQLAYLSSDCLFVLADCLIDTAAKMRGDRCPSEVMIKGQAHGLQAPPIEEHSIVTTWLASQEGPAALAGGYAVTLYRWLRRYAPPPPTPYDVRKIKAKAREDLHMVEIYREQAERGVLNDENSAWLAAWERDQRAVVQIVQEGEAARATKAAKAGAA